MPPKKRPGRKQRAAELSFYPEEEEQHLAEEFERRVVVEEPAAAAARPSVVPKDPKKVQAEEEDTLTLMKRPNVGKIGTPLAVLANYFPVTLPKKFVVYHYDMAFFRRQVASKKPKKGEEEGGATEPKDKLQEVSRLPRFLAVILLENLYTANEKIFTDRYALAFDGQKNLFSKDQLPFINDKDGKEFEVTIKNPDKNLDETFVIKVKQAAIVPVDLRQIFDRRLVDRKTVSTLILDVLLKQTAFFKTAFIPQGRRIFYYPEKIDNFPMDGGILRLPGFWQSMRPVSGWKVMLNMDQANTSFVHGGNVATDILSRLGFNPNDRSIDLRRLHNKLDKIAKGLKVTQTQRNAHRTSKCVSVSREAAETLMFPIQVGGKQQKISVANYFREQFKNGEFRANLKYPHLPCLQVGNQAKKNYIPLEFCEIKDGQRYPRKLDPAQTSQMLNYASQPAGQRKQLIQDDVEILKLNQDPYLTKFGLNVSLKMVEFGARVLPAPSIEYGQNKEIFPRDGGWNMQNNKLLRGCSIRNFAVICTTDRCSDQDINKFCYQWANVARQLSMTVVSDRPSKIFRERLADNMRQRLIDAKKSVAQLDLVFVILEGQNTDFYPAAKHAGDVEMGVNTQCVQLKNVQRIMPATLSNICLKINAKLGGENSKLTKTSMGRVKYFINEPILFLGADVNHATALENDEPVSCAAVVGNVDIVPATYCARIFLQNQEEVKEGVVTGGRRNQEWISDMKEGVKMTMDQFVRRNGILPRRIVMYRDGVGETMFSLILSKELPAIRQACTETADRYPTYVKKSGFKGAYEPPITFIVVQKRHHTRLFCADPRKAVGRGGNVPPGTTVDTDIVHPEEFDFYLCSHMGLQGTSRPAHYHVLWDDSNFSADDLQLMTYYLCHIYCRATKSVSIPPPCYYADLVAYRARLYLKGRLGAETSSVSSGTQGSGLSASALQQYVRVKENIVDKGMYFV